MLLMFLLNRQSRNRDSFLIFYDVARGIKSIVTTVVRVLGA